eukprot:465260_1
MPSRCALCSKTGATSICSGCNMTFYCNINCQRKHWKCHKKSCKSLAQKHKLSKTLQQHTQSTKVSPTKQLQDPCSPSSQTSPSPPTIKLKLLTKSRNSVELKVTKQQQLQLEQLAEETALLDKFRKVGSELSEFTHRLESNPDSIAFYLDNPER